MRVSRPVMALFAYAAHSGVSPGDLLLAAGLGPELFAGPDIDLDHPKELRLWSEATRLTGDAHFGLHMSEWLAPRADEAFDLLAFALRSCATLGDHYRRASRYLRLVHEGIYLTLEEAPDAAHLVHGLRHAPPGSPRQPVESLLSLALLLGRRDVGDDLAPLAVHFAHPRPDDASEHERVFRAPVHFGRPRNELVFEVATLCRPQRHAEPRLLALLSRQLDGLLAEQPDPQRFQERVQRAMLDDLPDHEPSVTSVSTRLHMSPRTLQRRLQDEGATFAGLLADVRRDVALRYLRDERLAIAEVGFLLGFRDVTAFHRAFKRWTGSTPAAYRRASAARA